MIKVEKSIKNGKEGIEVNIEGCESDIVIELYELIKQLESNSRLLQIFTIIINKCAEEIQNDKNNSSN
jgi:hypothetical protein